MDPGKMTPERKEITCKDTTWLVSDSCERPLTEQEQKDLQNHISECALCQGASTQFEVLFRQLILYFNADAATAEKSKS